MAFGIDPALAAPPAPDATEALWEQHAPALLAFLSVSSQWRTVAGGMGGLLFLGLDYQGAQAGFALAGMTMTPALWADVQLIEKGACAALNGKSE